jgi:AraC-like DNA-binding protein
MKTNTGFYAWNGTPLDRLAWVTALSKRGWQCRLDASRFGQSTMEIERAGQTEVVNINAAWQRVSPNAHRSSARWDEEYLIVNTVKSGMLSIEQLGKTLALWPGDSALLDPQHMFTVSLHEPTRVSALRVPKPALRERGLRYSFPAVLCPNPALADVSAVREVMLNLTSQAGKASEALLARLGDQCIDLIDVFIDGGNEPVRRRSTTATVLRAKQLIARRIGDPDLNAERIAAELNMSVSSLTRAFQASRLSTMRYVWSMRLERAARRLLADASHGAVKKIAYECGFANQAHFSRAFKARYGMTPREYAVKRETVRGPTGR